MASIYARGNKLWAKYRDASGEIVRKPTKYVIGQEDLARRYARRKEELAAEKRAQGIEAPLTVKRYAERWIKERTDRGMADAPNDATRLRLHALPHLGDLLLEELRPRHVRDMVRALRAGPLAPRSIRRVYGTLHTMLSDAECEERIPSNPCKLKRGELPANMDKDPEWRTEATYTVGEVERLISDPEIPPERRVLYALKALAGLRHGEAAGLRWRHYDPTREPLGRLTIATSYDKGRTKTEVTRRVPVHPTLAKVLAAWKLSHWERIYGSRPGDDDLVVPARTMRPVNPTDASRAMLADLAALGMRIKAGQNRNRGGHDLRSWFVTTCQEHGAHRDLLRVITHTSRGDIMDGYTRASWGALCAEVAKLKVQIRTSEVLELGTGQGTVERMARNRWGKRATPTGFEGPEVSEIRQESDVSGQNQGTGSAVGGQCRTRGVPSLGTVAQELARAVLDGDHERARELATELVGADRRLRVVTGVR